MTRPDKPKRDAVLAKLGQAGEPADPPSAEQATLNGIVKRQDQLSRDLDRAREQIERLERTVVEDPLLPMLSARAFLQDANRMLLEGTRNALPTTFLYISVDRFGGINERFGQSGGDAVLLSICGGIMRLLRGGDLIGRIGTDEFGIMFMHSDLGSVRRKCAQLVDLVQGRPIDYLGNAIFVTVMTSLLDCREFETPERLIEAARKDVQTQRANHPDRGLRGRLDGS